MSNLANKTVVVIGGSSGIGFGVALAALQSLASTVIIASSNSNRVEDAVKRLKAHNLSGEVLGEVVDANDHTALKEFAIRLGPVDHVAWTSGCLPRQFTGNDTGDLQTETFGLHFWGPFILSKHIQFNEGGSLTLTSGIMDLKPQKGVPLTSGTIAAVEGLVRGLAVDMAPTRVNVVRPGPILTELFDKIKVPAEVKENMVNDMQGKILLKRLGLPVETAEAYLFFMKCGFVTGQSVVVDGGYAL